MTREKSCFQVCDDEYYDEFGGHMYGRRRLGAQADAAENEHEEENETEKGLAALLLEGGRENNEDAPAGWKKTQIFELDRQVAVKRRSHYAS